MSNNFVNKSDYLDMVAANRGLSGYNPALATVQLRSLGKDTTKILGDQGSPKPRRVESGRESGVKLLPHQICGSDGLLW